MAKLSKERRAHITFKKKNILDNRQETLLESEKCKVIYYDKLHNASIELFA